MAPPRAFPPQPGHDAVRHEHQQCFHLLRRVARSAWHHRQFVLRRTLAARRIHETADLLLAPTLFQRAQKHGVKSALLSSKKKTTTLLSAGADLILTAEEPPEEWVRRLGSPAGIYSREINYWLMTAAIDLLRNRRDLGCLYVHTTD